MARRTRMSLILVLAFALSACQWQEQVNPLPGATVANIDPLRLAAAVPEPDPTFLPFTHFAAGQVLEQRGEYPHAATQYQKAVALNHEFIAAYNRLGLVLCRMGQPVKAERFFRQAIDKRPDRAYLRNNLAYSLMLQENWSAAEVELLTALQIKRDFPRGRVNLGICLGKQGHYEEAMAQFSEALSADQAYYNLGLLCKSNGEYGLAEQAFRQTLQVNPSSTAGARQLANILEIQHRQALVEAAEQVYQADARDLIAEATETTETTESSDAPTDQMVLQSPEADLAPTTPQETTLAEALPELQTTPQEPRMADAASETAEQPIPLEPTEPEATIADEAITATEAQSIDTTLTTDEEVTATIEEPTIESATAADREALATIEQVTIEASQTTEDEPVTTGDQETLASIPTIDDQAMTAIEDETGEADQTIEDEWIAAVEEAVEAGQTIEEAMTTIAAESVAIDDEAATTIDEETIDSESTIEDTALTTVEETIDETIEPDATIDDQAVTAIDEEEAIEAAPEAEGQTVAVIVVAPPEPAPATESEAVSFEGSGEPASTTDEATGPVIDEPLGAADRPLNPQILAEWLNPAASPELTAEQMLDLMWVPSAVLAPPEIPQAANNTQRAAGPVPAARTGEALRFGLLDAAFGWLRTLWDGMLAALTPSSRLESAETASVILPGRPGWFGYPNPWSWQLGWTWLACAQPQMEPTLTQPPDDWATVCHRALIDPDEGDQVFEWLRHQY